MSRLVLGRLFYTRRSAGIGKTPLLDTKWLRYYWDFCQKYAREPTDRQSFPAFREKLRGKQQSEAQCQQADAALSLYYEMVGAAPARERQPPGAEAKGAPPGARASSPPGPTLTDPALTSSPTSPRLPPGKKTAPAPSARSPQPSPAPFRHDRETPGVRLVPRQGSVPARAADRPRAAAGVPVTGVSWVAV